MAMTVGELKKFLQDAPDEAIFGIMGFANKAEVGMYTPKRFLLLKSKKEGGRRQFVLNGMGTHWNEEWEKENDARIEGWVDGGDYKLHLLKPET